MPKITIASLAALLLVSQSAGAFEFKGIRLNQPLEGPENRFFCEEHKSLFSDVRCLIKPNQRETIAGAQTKLVVIYLIDYKVATIDVSFASSDFGTIKSALTEKYGEGSITSEILSNAFGAKFENETISWTDSEGRMVVRRYAGKIDTGSLVIRSEHALTIFMQRKREQEAQNMGDL